MSAFWAKRDSDESEPHVEAPAKKMNGHVNGQGASAPPASAARPAAKKTSKNKAPTRSGGR
jgi:hypothetical protein